MSSAYFNTLNYTLANEDTTLEMNILPERAQHVVSVAGSGGRVLPLFAKNPQQVTCVDLSLEQLYLSELRIEAARVLPRQDFLCFFGYPPLKISPELRKNIFNQLNLSAECRVFFERVYVEAGWNSILYRGCWERTFAKIAKLCRSLLGDDALRMFEARNFNEHLLFVTRDFSSVRWNLLVFLIGNSTFFNALLYKGHFPQKNLPGSHRRYYKEAFNRIFATGVPRENFFLQLTLLGEILFEEGNPIECQPGIYEQVQAGIRQAKINYQQANVLDFVSQGSGQSIDFVSLSDVPSYFDDATSRDFLERMGPGLAAGGIVVARFYLRVINWMTQDTFERISHQYDRLIEREKTQMYYIDVFKKKPNV
ncbi:DUF3419 family protein [bacterium]|nr:DUF3419 family protein [bacterium]